MFTLKVLSALLSYPEEETLAELPEMAEIVAGESLLRHQARDAVLDFIARFARADLLSLQETYVDLFDRGRALSLHMFEHVHGESRDRGQAMVNLLSLYQEHGFAVCPHELPDYIPLFLEFLANQPGKESLPLLTEALPVLSLLRKRLFERESSYVVLFDALADIANSLETAGGPWSGATDGPWCGTAASAGSPVADLPANAETMAELDCSWQEEKVTFTGSEGPQSACLTICPSQISSHCALKALKSQIRQATPSSG